MTSASSPTKNMLSASTDADNSDVDDAFRFDAMSPVKSEDGTTLVLPGLHEDQKQGENKTKLLKIQMEAKQDIHVKIFLFRLMRYH